MLVGVSGALPVALKANALDLDVPGTRARACGLEDDRPVDVARLVEGDAVLPIGASVDRGVALNVGVLAVDQEGAGAVELHDDVAAACAVREGVGASGRRIGDRADLPTRASRDRRAEALDLGRSCRCLEKRGEEEEGDSKGKRRQCTTIGFEHWASSETNVWLGFSALSLPACERRGIRLRVATVSDKRVRKGVRHHKYTERAKFYKERQRGRPK